MNVGGDLDGNRRVAVNWSYCRVVAFQLWRLGVDGCYALMPTMGRLDWLGDFFLMMRYCTV